MKQQLNFCGWVPKGYSGIGIIGLELRIHIISSILKNKNEEGNCQVVNRAS